MLPREKFLLKGISAISDIELIQILVGCGNKNRNFKQISSSIMKVIKAACLEEKEVSITNLSSLEGVGEVTAMRILSGIELGKRVYGLYDKEIIRITQSQQAYELFKDMKDLKKERVDIVCLNSRFEYIFRETVAVGSLNCASILPRDILYPAITNNSAFVVMAHNHPSGDSTPSEEDIIMTKRLVDSLEMVGVQLLDHLIISKKGWSCITI
jgi:DNA repair protein RadC